MKTNFYFCATLITLIFFSSCTTSKVDWRDVTLPKGTKISKVGVPHSGSPKNEVIIYKTNKRTSADILIGSKDVKLNLHVPVDKLIELGKYSVDKTKTESYITDGYFQFPFEMQYANLISEVADQEHLYDIQKSDGKHSTIEKIKYQDGDYFGQGITFPFKLRNSIFLEDERIRLDYKILTGFNGGILLGYKYGINNVESIYNSETKSIVNINTSNISFGLGIFGGLTTIKYTSQNTINPTLFTADRTLLGFTYGASIFTTFHDFTLGLAYGYDRPRDVRAQRNNWIYTGEPWYGLTFGFKILK